MILAGQWTGKTADLRGNHLDVVMGLTARAHGARLITRHCWVRSRREFEIDYWRVW
jgi:hypothetical protein